MGFNVEYSMEFYAMWAQTHEKSTDTPCDSTWNGEIRHGITMENVRVPRNFHGVES